MIGKYIGKMVCLGVLALTATTVMAQGRAGFGNQQAKSRGDGSCLITSLPLQSLDDEEIAGLMHMLEEEKLARDVYQTMYSLWEDGTFQRISQSEQRHMDAVGRLLERYGLEDPVAVHAVGEFDSIELQNMYRDLVAAGQMSPADALKVGATIEDLDLYDLEEALNTTDNDDIKMVYENLMRGSQNHMRAFIGRLEILDESYAPQYISEETLSGILASGNTSGSGWTGRGRGMRRGGVGRGVCLRTGIRITQ